jgi:hypothetical protein
MRQTKFGPQPAKQILREKGFSIARASVELGVTQGHLQSCVDGNVRPSADVQAKLPTLVDRPLEDLFAAVVLNWVDQRSMRHRRRTVSMLTDTPWWHDGYVQVARDDIIKTIRRRELAANESFVSETPQEELYSFSTNDHPMLWKYTWEVIAHEIDQ